MQHLSVEAQQPAWHGGHSAQHGRTAGQLRPKHGRRAQPRLDLNVHDQDGRRKAQLAALAGTALVDVSVSAHRPPGLATPVLDLVARLQLQGARPR